MSLYNKSLRDQIADKCIHFNGLVNDKCEAGVKYASVKVKGEAGVSFPCVEGLSHNPEATCDKREWPSEKCIQARLATIAESNRKMALVMPLIGRIKTEHKGESWQGIEECPVCKGKLHLSISGYNGHCHGRCETDDCLAWME